MDLRQVENRSLARRVGVPAAMGSSLLPAMSDSNVGDSGVLPITLDALPQILESLRPDILRTALQIDPSDAEDAVQQALETALLKFNQFQGQTDAELRGWLRTIVRNACLMRLRRRRETSGISSFGPLVTPEETPSAAVRRDEERAQLIDLLTQLGESEREAVLLRYFENWSIKLIAAQMQRTEMAVAGLLKRGLAKLRASTSPSQWSRLLGA